MAHAVHNMYVFEHYVVVRVPLSSCNERDWGEKGRGYQLFIIIIFMNSDTFSRLKCKIDLPRTMKIYIHATFDPFLISGNVYTILMLK